MDACRSAHGDIQIKKKTVGNIEIWNKQKRKDTIY